MYIFKLSTSVLSVCLPLYDFSYRDCVEISFHYICIYSIHTYESFIYDKILQVGITPPISSHASHASLLPVLSLFYRLLIQRCVFFHWQSIELVIGQVSSVNFYFYDHGLRMRWVYILVNYGLVYFQIHFVQTNYTYERKVPFVIRNLRFGYFYVMYIHLYISINKNEQGNTADTAGH